MNNLFAEFRRIERKLQHLTLIAEQASEGIMVLDLNGIVRFVNMAMAKMHGYASNKELIGKPINIFYTKTR